MSEENVSVNTSFIKKYWKILAAVLATSIVLFMLKSNHDSSAYIKQMQESHAKELEEINKAREEERKQYEENEKKYKERMAAIEAEYETAKKEFDEKKKEQAAKLLRDFKGKPVELAKKLSEVTGYKVILPEE